MPFFDVWKGSGRGGAPGSAVPAAGGAGRGAEGVGPVDRPAVRSTVRQAPVGPALGSGGSQRLGEEVMVSDLRDRRGRVRIFVVIAVFDDLERTECPSHERSADEEKDDFSAQDASSAAKQRVSVQTLYPDFFIL